MKRKRFNWGGFIAIFIYIAVISLCSYASYFIVAHPTSSFSVNFGEGGNPTLFITLGVILLIVGAFLTPAIFKYFAVKTYAKNAFINATEFTTQARVSSKSFEVIGDRFSTSTICYISFDFLDGRRISFKVDSLQYNVLVENDIGLLKYKQQGDYYFFISFQRQG